MNNLSKASVKAKTKKERERVCVFIEEKESIFLNDKVVGVRETTTVFMFQFDCATRCPGTLVKHYSRHFWVFLDETNMYIRRLSKADCSP